MFTLAKAMSYATLLTALVGTAPVAGATTTATAKATTTPGFTADVNLGGSKAVGGGSDNSSFGVGFSTRVGYNLGKWGLTPEMMISYSRWGISGPGDGSLSMLGVTFGSRYTYELKLPVSFWGGLHLGYGHGFSSSGGASSSKGGFALNFGLGADYRITKNLSAGLFFDVNKTFVGDQNGQQIASMGLNFGASVRLRI